MLEGVIKEGIMEERRSKLGVEMLMEMQEEGEMNDSMEREGSTQESTGGAPPHDLISSYVTPPCGPTLEYH